MGKIQKKIIGIIGGMGSVAAANMFEQLVALTPATSDQDYIETIIHNNTSIPDRTQGILYNGKSPLPELMRSVSLLNSSICDYIMLACVTSHYYIPQLQSISEAKIIDGVAETVKYIKATYPKIKKAGVIASTGAVKVAIFQNKLQEYNIETIVLNDVDQEKYFTEPIYQEWGIKAGNLSGKPRNRIKTAADILCKKGADVIIAGCSEIPLVLNTDDLDVPLIDTINIMIKAAIEKCLLKQKI